MIYKSISGFTKKYAEWIAEDCKADLFESTAISQEMLSDYSVIIFGGSLHAVGINGIKLLKKNLPSLADKKIIVFAVGASPPKDGIMDEISENNFSDLEHAKIKLFYLRGGFNFKKLNFSNKILMAFYRIRIILKKNKTPDEIGMLAAYSKPMDFTKKESIKPITKYVQSL